MLSNHLKPIYKAIKALNKLNLQNFKENAVEFGQVKKESFGLKKEYSKEFEFIVKQLTLKINFIDESLSKSEDFIKIMSTDDISSISTKIHFGCETTEVRYIFDKLRIMFTSLTFAKIERSKLFYTEEGNLLTAGNLSASKIEKTKRKKEIDKVFNDALK